MKFSTGSSSSSLASDSLSRKSTLCIYTEADTTMPPPLCERTSVTNRKYVYPVTTCPNVDHDTGERLLHNRPVPVFRRRESYMTSARFGNLAIPPLISHPIQHYAFNTRPLKFLNTFQRNVTVVVRIYICQ
ncbi:hypothetical protein KGM_208815 [Danaus plexippus plexippus]|uniref:Uncharacterized protein n=1 Tax=Danaus plexippus plexippus TaxID=278856 RepID=A0A212EMF3_DANPL|nr:hypothetical protein KGM_208815 [Danaus plexippus plexippus]